MLLQKQLFTTWHALQHQLTAASRPTHVSRPRQQLIEQIAFSVKFCTISKPHTHLRRQYVYCRAQIQRSTKQAVCVSPSTYAQGETSTYYLER
jgi:hypothetical protein